MLGRGGRALRARRPASGCSRSTRSTPTRTTTAGCASRTAPGGRRSTRGSRRAGRGLPRGSLRPCSSCTAARSARWIRATAAAALLLDGDRIAAVLDDPADAPRGAERSTSQGGCALPGFTDAHVHFPTWALARRELRPRRRAARSPRRSHRVGRRAPPPAAGCAGAAGATSCGPTATRPTGPRSTRSTGATPVALRAHDSHSLWLNSAALALAGGDLETPGGVVERDAAGEPTGILREEAAWRFEARFAPEPRRGARRHARGAAGGRRRGRRRRPRQGRRARRARAVRRARAAASCRCRVWQSVPGATPDVAPTRRRLREGVHGRHARLAHRAAARRHGRRDHVVGRARRHHPRAPPRTACPSPSTRSATAPTARRSTRSRRPRRLAPLGLRQRIEHAQCVAPRRRPAVRAARRRRVGPVHPRARPTATSPTGCGRARRRTPTPTARCTTPARALAGGSDAPIEPLDPLAGLRAAVLPHRRRPARVAAGAGARRSTPRSPRSPPRPPGSRARRTRRGRLAPGLAADLVVLDRDPGDDLAGARVAGTMLAGDWLLGP